MRTRILHVITRLEPGGAQRNTLYTVEHLDRGQFEPALAWGPGDPLDEAAAAIPDLRREPVPELVRPISLALDRRALQRLVGVVRRLQPQVVHTHSSKAGVLGRLAARIGRAPVVVHSIHGFGFTPLQPGPVRMLYVIAERVMARWTDHFVAVSESNLRAGLALGLFPPERASVIRSGIELGRFHSPAGGREARERLGVPEGAPLVVQVGNFKPQKAPLDFVRVAAAVARQAPGAWFVMVGDGELRAAAEELASDLAVAGRIVFCGWWDDIPGLLAASRVSVLTSRHEGLPRAAVESLAAGVPVVATAVDGTPEVVKDGRNGFLVEAGDVAGLARRVSQLLRDDGLHRRLAAAAGEGLDEFDIDRMVREQEELYRWLLGRSRS
ncbi:MAG TPA: glycosyltransferase family 4 protein [Thermoanaerobaculales bacterium]|nr:glycosyltransferase family 4 protein [Thermoanaerobaculales bacterium]HQN95654.1 glycosyltransferase family 4 protein [Thermoanaerobaculales bacterium]HQP44150.1 glycosyltransferase family 4 protein [Thermoanaerobaculales bacterium]